MHRYRQPPRRLVEILKRLGPGFPGSPSSVQVPPHRVGGCTCDPSATAIPVVKYRSEVVTGSALASSQMFSLCTAKLLEARLHFLLDTIRRPMKRTVTALRPNAPPGCTWITEL